MTLTPAGTYRVAKQIGQWAAFAQVTVVVIERDDEPIVTLADESQLDQEGRYLEGLSYGAAFAFQEVPNSESLGIFVTDLRTMSVDSTSQSIAYATCFAIWDVLGHTSKNPPYFNEESKTFVFPE